MKKIFILLLLQIVGIGMANAQSDLQILGSNVTITTPNGNHIGQEMDIAFSVENIGNISSGNTAIRIYLSSNQSTTNAKVLGNISLEALLPFGTTGVIHFKHAIPYGVSATSYIIISVNPDVVFSEMYSGNNECISPALNINTNAWATQFLPCPVILVHGFMSNNETWDDLIDAIRNQYGWSLGGNMNFCLNQDGNVLTSDSTTDFKDYTNAASLQADDLFTLNFAVDQNGQSENIYLSQSNKSAITKQGLAVKEAISHVLQVTNKNDVILLGHSMGGLAAREYLQNSIYHQNDGFKHVTKLATLGTPHSGAGIAVLGPILLGTEALRDMAYPSYIKLEGGSEYDLTGLFNFDVDCNGNSSDLIAGLNNLPIANISISCGVGINPISGDDGIVSAYSAYIDNHLQGLNSDSFQLIKPFLNFGTLAWHNELPKQVKDIVKLLDEPTNIHQGYSIGFDTTYQGTITQQSGKWINKDYDCYKIKLVQETNFEIEICNIPVDQFAVKIYNSTGLCVDNINSNGKSYLKFITYLNSGNYSLVFEAIPTENSWLTPYAFTLKSIPATCNNNVSYTSNSGIIKDHLSMGNYGNLNNCEWLIQPTGASQIYLWFNSFMTADTNDLLKVYDGPNNSYPLIGTYSGGNIPSMITSTTGSLFLNFITDANLTAPGWEAQYSTSMPTPNSYYEYWFDDNYASKIITSYSGTGILDLMTNVDLGDLQTGLHVFHIRFKSMQGIWSSISSTLFVKKEIPDLSYSEYEYWFDDNNSLKWNVPYSDNSPFDLTSNIKLGSLSTGLHVFHIRFKSSLGVWSSISSNLFIKSANPSVTNAEYEYWFDNDYSQKIISPYSDSSSFNLLSDINLDSLTIGLHTFNIRFKSSHGVWSSISSSLFIKNSNSVSGPSEVQYWFDDDFGNSISSSLPNTTPINWIHDLELNGLSNGIHSLHLRFKLGTNEWSSVTSNLFIKNGESIISTPVIQYWFDDNFLQAVSIDQSNVSSIDWASDITVTGLPTGSHVLNARFKLSNGLWSSVVRDTFNKLNNYTPVTVKVLLQGYYSGSGTMTTTLLNEGVSNDLNVTDTITAELHSASFPYDLVSSKKGVLNLGGVSDFIFPITTGTDYLVIKHRNSVETWSANPILLNADSINYDFTTSANKAYGGNMVEVETGTWAIYSGDINQDGAIDAFDYIILDPDIFFGNFGYLDSDLNGDGVVDAFDYVIFAPNLYDGVGLLVP